MGNQPGKSRLRPQTVGSGFDSLMAHNTSRSSGCELNHLTCFFVVTRLPGLDAGASRVINKGMQAYGSPPGCQQYSAG